MNDLKSAFRQLRKNPVFTVHPPQYRRPGWICFPQCCSRKPGHSWPYCYGGRAVALLTLALGVGVNTPALAHPGSGIVVDRRGQVFFTDTGQGVRKVDEQGRLSAHEGPAYHWMAIDHDGLLARTRWPPSREPSTDIQRIGTDPTLLLSSDFPLTTAPDGNLYFPELGEGDLLRVYRLTPSGERSVLATLATASDGQPLKWLNGMAAGPDGVIYFSENAAVRRITPRGEVSTLASNIVVDDCQPLPGASPRLGPYLRGLDVAPDGSVYVAANGCCALLKINPQGQVTPVLRSISPWSPTSVAVHGDAVLVLEYLHTVSGVRRDWTPRVRQLSRDAATVLAAVERTPGGGSRSALIPVANTFEGAKAGDEIEVNGVKLCWCPPGKFIMGSPRSEPERRPGEDQVEVTLTKGFWMAKFEASQGDWKRLMGKPYNGGEPGPSLGRAAKVGSYPANPWGLHDMHGNTFEWCRDWYHSRLPGGVDPDLYAAQSTSRVRRGGAWTDHGWPCRSAFRLRFEPHRRYDHIGFRVVAVQP